MASSFDGLKSLNGPVLVTGHTGFKGAWLSLMLNKMGVETVGFSLPPEPGSLATELKDSIWSRQYFADIRNQVEVSAILNEIKPSFVFHLAAQALVLESYLSPVETFETNVLGTAYILEAAREVSDVRGLVIATTDKVYNNINLGRKFKETDSLMGSDPYSASKVGTEAVVKAWQTLTEKRQDFGITSVRSGNVIGGGDNARNRLLPDLIRGFSNREQVIVRNPNSTRPWQHVADPLYGYLMTAESILKNNFVPSLNFGPGEKSLTVEEVVIIARESWGDATEVKIIDSEPNYYEAKLLELDATLAAKVLKWSPEFPQIDSVKSTVSWWKQKLTGKASATEACESDLERYEF